MSTITGVSDSSSSYYVYAADDQVENGVQDTDPNLSGGDQVWTQEERDQAVQNETNSMSQTISDSDKDMKEAQDNYKKSMKE